MPRPSPTPRLADSITATGAIERLAPLGRRLVMGEGCMVAAQGTPIDTLSMVVSGRLVTSRRIQGQDVPIEIIGRGVLIGLEGLCGAARHGLNARSLTKVTLDLIPADTCRTLIRTAPDMALMALALLSLRLRQCIADTDRIKQTSATSRTASFLLSLVTDPESAAGPQTVKLPMSKKAIAAHVGITQQSLSRILRHLRPAGINVSGRTVHIAAPLVLAAIADGGE